MTVNSTVPGLAHLEVRNEHKKTPFGFLEARRKVDGAEELWRIRNSLYDLETFMKSHPGGAEWLSLTKGTDITELFEVSKRSQVRLRVSEVIEYSTNTPKCRMLITQSHHITDKAERLLPKFYVREATTPRSVPLTFHPDGFYRTFKRRATEALKNVNFHRSSLTSNLITDSLAAMTFALALTGAFVHSYSLVLFAGEYSRYCRRIIEI